MLNGIIDNFNVSPREAIGIQNKLKGRIIKQDVFKEIKTIAGADISLSKFDHFGFAGIIVYKYPELIEIERTWIKSRINFPYVPGLLSFRETPLLIKAFKRLRIKPDILILDGQGIAHPRRFGIASHLGLILDIPTIGCAKSKLIGSFKEPPLKAGNFSYLYDEADIIGAVVRTKLNVKPIFVSIGHKISLDSAIQIMLNCRSGFRIPKPTREADIFVGQIKRQLIDI